MSEIFFKNDKITLRKGKKEDSHLIAELIYSSGPEIFDYLFSNKQKALDYIKFEFRTGLPSLFGKTYSWVGEDNQGNIISSAITYGKKENYLMTIGTIIKIIAFYKFKTIKPLKKLSIMGKIVKPPKKNEWFLSCFGVKPEFRGKGISKLVIDEQMKWAKSNGYSFYGLDVAENNLNAKRLYERMGLKVYKKTNSHISMVPNSYRMEMDL